MIMNLNIEGQTSTLVTLITELQPLLNDEALRIRKDAEVTEKMKFDADSWCRSVMGDSLVKLRLFTEQNFNYIETMSILAVTRYIFEMSVWLLLFKMDSRYGLVYYSRLIETQLRYWQDCKVQTEREVLLLKKFESEEKSIMDEELKKLNDIIDPKIKEKEAFNLSSFVMKKIDDKADRHFSIYAEQAKSNGYSFQAHLVENKQLPIITSSIAELENEKTSFLSSIPDDIKLLIPKRWNWCDMAKKVDLGDEYEYIYSYTSKLLHATPSSITTNQKNLELSEINIFLKYVRVKINDILSLAKQYS
ncbi:hypothetical protein H5088_01680 [Pseudoalteromonas sp. SR43-3]|nr:hypothetical protein [Pseudoalteromonas sp. SR43-3]